MAFDSIKIIISLTFEEIPWLFSDLENLRFSPLFPDSGNSVKGVGMIVLTDYEPSKVGQGNFSNNNELRSHSTEANNFTILMNMYGKYSTKKERKKKGCN